MKNEIRSRKITSAGMLGIEKLRRPKVGISTSLIARTRPEVTVWAASGHGQFTERDSRGVRSLIPRTN